MSAPSEKKIRPPSEKKSGTSQKKKSGTSLEEKSGTSQKKKSGTSQKKKSGTSLEEMTIQSCINAQEKQYTEAKRLIDGVLTEEKCEELINSSTRPVGLSTPLQTDARTSGNESSKLFVSYNTSYPNDAHYTQVLGNTFLSESAALVRKAMRLSGSESEYLSGNPEFTFDKLISYFETESNVSTLTQNIKENNNKIINYLKLKNDEKFQIYNSILMPDMSKQLGYLRITLADVATEYIINALKNEKPNCVALIEQMIHVQGGHQASYSGLNMKSNLAIDFDLGAKGNNEGFPLKNEFFGILRRINLLKSSGVKINDIDFNPLRSLQRNESFDYFIVYDNVVNLSTIGFGSPAPAEGIALIVKREVCPELFEWDVDKLPVKSKLKQKNDVNANYTFNGNVHYYSDDFGNVISSYKTPYAGVNDKFTGKDLFRFRTSTRGFPDLGRPIILTAGINGDNLNIFVALHNANLFNLAYLGDEFYDNNSESTDLLKVNGDVTPDYVTGTKNGTKKARKLGDIAKDAPEHPDLVALYSSVIYNIGKFITDALSSTRSFNKSTQFKINLYLGGDFNDPNGGIFKLLTHGDRVPIKIKIGDQEEQSIYIQSNYDTGLLSCCANLDSQDRRYQKGFDKALTADLATAFTRIIPNSTHSYPENFIDYKKFGYFGDYAFVGSQINPSTGQASYGIKLDSKLSPVCKIGDNSVMASDHLPVYAEISIPATAGGARRRRYSKRALKSKTRKAQKKLRASRRNRKVRTRRNL